MSVNRIGGAAHELGAGLRALRERAGLTTRALGDLAKTNAANISNWENANRLPSEERLTQVLDALDASDDERERLSGLRRQAEGPPGQLTAGAPSIGVQLARLIEHEQVARRITDVAPLVIPGLLQTGDYARAMLTGLSDIDTRIALRVGRRDVLTRPENPAELVALISTEALIRPIAAPRVMAYQLKHLLAMAELPNVTIQLVSATTRGYTPMVAGPFILLEFATATPIVHLEHHQASAFLWQPGDVRGFETAAEKIHEVAMSPEDSSGLIAEIVHGMETT